MKKYISIILLLLGAVLNVAAQNRIAFSSEEGHKGDVVTVEVTLENCDPISGLEIHIPLFGKELEYVDGSAILVPERVDGHALNTAVVDNTLRIYVYSISLNDIRGNEGKLLSFDLKLGKQPAHYPLRPQVILGAADGSACPVEVEEGIVTMLAPQIEVVTKSIDFGHVPVRGNYTATLELRNSGTEPLEVTGLQFSADVFSAVETEFTIVENETKCVTIEYGPEAKGSVNESVAIVSNAINGTASVMLIADPYMVNELYVCGGEGFSYDEVTVQLVMNNMEPIAGVQVDLELPEALEYVDGSFVVAERSAQHTAVATFKDGVGSLLLFSSTNSEIESGEGVVATLRLRLVGQEGVYTLVPENVQLGNNEAVNVMSAAYEGTVAIVSPKMLCEDMVTIPASSITETAEGVFVIGNDGNAPLEIEGVAFLADGFKVKNDLPLVIEQGCSDTVFVEYSPVKSGTYSTTMNLYTNDPYNRVKSVIVDGYIYEPNYLEIDGENLQDGNYMISIGMDNYTDIVAIQMDIHFVQGMATSNSMLQVSQRLAGHTCSIAKINDTTWRFVAFSLSNATVTGNEGKLFDLTFIPDEGVECKDMPITVDNIVLSSVDAGNCASQLVVETKAEYKNYLVRFMCDGEVVGEFFQRAGTAIVYPQIEEKTGYTAVWNIAGTETFKALPIDLASNADEMLYSNAYCTVSGSDQFNGWHVLFDNDENTYFHSEWADKNSADGLDHYLRIDLGEEHDVEKFAFNYANRIGHSVGSPTKIVVEGSNVADGPYVELAELTGMPVSNSVYTSDTIENFGGFRYIRLMVTETYYNRLAHGHPFFYISEFGMVKFAEENIVLDVMPENDVVFEAKYTPNRYNIIYEVDGEVFGTALVKYGSDIVLPDEPVKEGYTFSGWNDVPETMPAEDIVITGSFAVNYYAVTYIVDGEAYATYSVAYGAELPLPEDPELYGYYFNGWIGVPESMPAEDIVIEGSFVEDETTDIDELQISESKEICDLQGRKINEITESGIYIVNGKKILVK